MTLPARKNSSPLVTVLMPLYNHANHVAETVDSILQQTLEDFELLVIDDGSTDGSEKVVAALDDSRIRLITRPHAGLTDTLNYGITEARGRYIARADSHDLMLGQRLESQLAHIHDRPSVGILGGQASLINDEGELIGEIRRPTDPASIREYARYASPIIHATFLGSTEVFKKLGGYRNIVAAEDLDLLLRAIERGYELSNVPDTVMRVRYSSDGISELFAKTQLANTRRVIKSHKLRTAGKPEPTELYVKMSKPADNADAWFRYWWRRRSSAADGMRRNRGIRRIASGAAFLASSLAHRELAAATWGTWKLRSHKS